MASFVATAFTVILFFGVGCEGQCTIQKDYCPILGCTYMYSPICAEDTVTSELKSFANECIMRLENCEKDTNFVYLRDDLCESDLEYECDTEEE